MLGLEHVVTVPVTPAMRPCPPCKPLASTTAHDAAFANAAPPVPPPAAEPSGVSTPPPPSSPPKKRSELVLPPPVND